VCMPPFSRHARCAEMRSHAIRSAPMRAWIASLLLAACTRGGVASGPVPPAKAAASPVLAPPVTQIDPAPVPAPACPDRTLDFAQLDGQQPAGWSNSSSYSWSTATDIKHGRERALRLQSAGNSKFGAVTASVPAGPVRGKHLKLRGWIKTDDAKGWAA